MKFNQLKIQCTVAIKKSRNVVIRAHSKLAPFYFHIYVHTYSSLDENVHHFKKTHTGLKWYHQLL